jgi:hypothetical protein
MAKKFTATENIKPEEYDYSHTCRTCKHCIIIHSLIHCGCDTPPRMLSNQDIFTAHQCKNREREVNNDAR